MRHSPEYRVQRFAQPPTAEEIQLLTRRGWRLVSVTRQSDDAPTDNPFVVYLERRSAPQPVHPKQSPPPPIKVNRAQLANDDLYPVHERLMGVPA